MVLDYFYRRNTNRCQLLLVKLIKRVQVQLYFTLSLTTEQALVLLLFQYNMKFFLQIHQIASMCKCFHFLKQGLFQVLLKTNLWLALKITFLFKQDFKELISLTLEAKVKPFETRTLIFLSFLVFLLFQFSICFHLSIILNQNVIMPC